MEYEMRNQVIADSYDWVRNHWIHVSIRSAIIPNRQACWLVTINLAGFNLRTAIEVSNNQSPLQKLYWTLESS